MKLNNPVDPISKTLSQEQDFSLRIEADEAIKLAQMAMKRNYDRNHQVLKEFNVGDQEGFTKAI
jgi:hypothetical protein